MSTIRSGPCKNFATLLPSKFLVLSKTDKRGSKNLNIYIWMYRATLPHLKLPNILSVENIWKWARIGAPLFSSISPSTMGYLKINFPTQIKT